MSKVKFRIGSVPGVLFNLPSRAYGDSNTLMGKVSVDVGELKYSNELSFDKQQLIELCLTAKTIRDNSKGKVEIQSKCSRFKLVLSATPKGHVEVTPTTSGFKFAGPENIEWEAKSRFQIYPEGLDNLVDSESEIRS